MKVLKRLLSLVLVALLFVGTLPYYAFTTVHAAQDFLVFTMKSETVKQGPSDATPTGTDMWGEDVISSRIEYYADSDTYAMLVSSKYAYYKIDRNPYPTGGSSDHLLGKVSEYYRVGAKEYMYGEPFVYEASRSTSDNTVTVTVTIDHASELPAEAVERHDSDIVEGYPSLSISSGDYMAKRAETRHTNPDVVTRGPTVDGIRQDITNYIAYGLRCAWLHTRPDNSGLNGDTRWPEVDIIYAFMNGDRVLHGATATLFNDDWSVCVGVSEDISPSLEDVVRIAFGDRIVNACTSTDPAAVGAYILTDDERSILCMIWHMGIAQALGMHSTDVYLQYMKTEEERRSEQAIGNAEFSSAAPTDPFSAIRFVARNWGRVQSAGGWDAFRDISQLPNANNDARNMNAAYQWLEGQHVPGREPNESGSYTAGINSAYTPPGQNSTPIPAFSAATPNSLVDAYAYLCFGSRAGASYQFNPPHGEGAAAPKSCPYTLSEVLSALEALKGYKQNSPGVQTSDSIVSSVQTWPDRYKVAVGVMCNLIDQSNLQYLEIHQDNTIVSVLPPSWMDASESGGKYNRWGFAAVIWVSQDLLRMSYNTINYLGPIVQTENPSFTSYTKEVLAVRDLYECFVLAGDSNLWHTWNTTSFDFRSSASTTGSMSMGNLYDRLQAHDAFTIVANYDVNASQPFAYFFDTQSRKLSDYMTKGIKLSAQFIPMHTNVYDPYTWSQSGVDSDWLLNFYIKFGYFRKALYIDTNPDAAVNFVNTGGKGTLRVATLKDLMEEKDIVLYIDENLYNVNKIADLIDMSWDRIGQDSQSSTLGAWDSFTSAISGLWSVSMEELAKTAERTTYSTRVGTVKADGKWDKFLMPIGGEEWQEMRESNAEVDIGDVDAVESASPEPTESAVPSESSTTTATDTDTIAKYLYADQLLTDTGVLRSDYEQVEYSYMSGFAVLSGVYRDVDLLKALNSVYSRNTPVFIASDTAPFISDTYRTTIYNWMMVRNLESQLTVDYQSSIDMECPLYMDVFGNILTESGYIVIPAASNATLWKPSEFQPYSAGFCTTYGDSYLLPVDKTDTANKVNDMLKVCFGEQDGKWVMRNIQTVDGSVNLAKLSVGSKDSLQALADTFAYSLQSNEFYTISFWQMLITEVLRGCPVEYIDKQFEGIQTNTTYTKQGLIVADKLETLVDALSAAGQNAALAIPNPAYMDGIEIIVFFVYKVLILGVLVMWMTTVYFDATGGELSLRTGAKCIGIVCLVLALVVGVPKLFELTYYESNKYMLQDETEYLMMLNLEKKVNGEEIGVSSVSVPRTNTKLYLHLSDVEMPWWDLLTSISTSAGYKSLDEMYASYEYQHPLAYSDQATTLNGAVYIDTDTLFDSTRVSFSASLNTLFVSATGETPASYYTPYYYFLDQITQEVTIWSKRKDYIAYTTKVQRGGQLRTLGYCQAFFGSEDFIEEGADYFNLYALYGVQAPREYEFLPSIGADDVEGGPEDEVSVADKLRSSQWCAYHVASERATQKRIEELNKYAQGWIARNYGMIGKVSDETFLKCFALSCAMEHNRLFNTQRADYLEIYELSNEDLLRLSVANHDDVMSSSTMSYARFVYTQGGTIAVYLAAILELVNFIGAWVKPACTLLVFLIACISIFVMKLILRRGNNSIYGYVTTIALMCSVNIAGSLSTKLSMYIPNLGFTTAVNILALIILQVAYIFLQIKIVSVALKDWRNVGFQRHQSAVSSFNFFGSRDRRQSRDVNTPRVENGWEYFNNLSNRQLNRRRRA